MRPSRSVAQAIRVVLLHKRTSAVVEVQRAFEARGMMVFPVVTPDELTAACRRLAPHVAVVRCSAVSQGLDVVRWLHGQVDMARLPVLLLGPFSADECPRGHAGLLGCLDERVPLEELAAQALALTPSRPVAALRRASVPPGEGPESVAARLAREGRTGLLVVTEDGGPTTVVAVGPEVRRLRDEDDSEDQLHDPSSTTNVEFIETGQQQRLGLVDLGRASLGPPAAALPPGVKALVIEQDAASAAAIAETLASLAVDAMRLAPGPGWLEHAVDYWPHVVVSDARPRGPRGFEFLREQAGDPVLSWVPTLLVAAPTTAAEEARALAAGVLAAELAQALEPGLELVRLLDRPEPSKGEVDRYGMPRLLAAVCERRRDALVGTVDEWNTFVFSVSGGRLVSARQQGSQGGRSAGPGALARALLTRSGRFTVGPADVAIQPNLSGELDTQLASARAMIRSLSSERGQGPGRALGCDEGMLHKRLEDAEPRRRTMIECLIMGADPRRAAQQIGLRPEEARELIEELFRFGAIGIVRHLEGDARPSSDEAVSALSRFAAGVPEELRPLFELEETEVSSYSPEAFSFDFEPAGPEEEEVSRAGVDLSFAASEGGVDLDGDGGSLPALDVGVDALIAEEPLPVPRGTAAPEAEDAGFLAGGPEPQDLELLFDDDAAETASTVPAPRRGSGAAAPAPERGAGLEPETVEDVAVAARPGRDLPRYVSPAPGAAPPPLDPVTPVGGPEAGSGLTPKRSAVATDRVRAARPRRRMKARTRFLVLAASLVLAAGGGILTGLAVLRWGGGAGGRPASSAPRPAATRADGGALEVALGPVPDASPPRPAGDACVAAAATGDGAPASDAASDAAAPAGGAASDAAAGDGAAASDWAAAADGGASGDGGGGAGDGGVGPLELRRFGPDLRIPRSERARSRLARREVQLGSRAAKRRDFERAAWHYDRAVKLVPASPAGLVGLGEALARLGHHDEAATVLDRAVHTTKGHHLLVRAGYACLAAGDNGCARRAFEKALARRASREARRGLRAVDAAERL